MPCHNVTYLRIEKTCWIQNQNCDNITYQSFEKFQMVHSTLTMNLNDAVQLFLEKLIIQPRVEIKFGIPKHVRKNNKSR